MGKTLIEDNIIISFRLLWPHPKNLVELYFGSLKHLGINPQIHDLRLVEDNQITNVGCLGLGWEVWLNGMEVTQFTYFQQVGGLGASCYRGTDLRPGAHRDVFAKR